MDNFFRENEVKVDNITNAYTKETLVSYAHYLISEKTPFTLILLNVDNFTYITDAFGINGGNKVLHDIADVIKSVACENGYLARGNSDEFLLILKNIASYDEIWNYCHTILVKITEIGLPEIGNQTLTVTMGASKFPENGANYDSLLLCSDKALYRGKTKGRNCFIIYIPEKHENLSPKNEKQKALGSLNLHSNIFRFLTTADDLKLGIENLFNFLSSYFELDHICIQSNEKLLFQKIHQISKTKEFLFVPHELVRESTNKVTGVLYLNDAKNLLKAKHEEFYHLLQEQNVTSTCFCEISYRDTFYGMLRVDMTGVDDSNKLLQYSDMDLLLSAAKTIALILHYSGKTFETL